MTQKMTAHDYLVREELDDLADELDAMTAERDALRAESVEWSAQYERLSHEAAALRAQLDGMTTEVHSEWKFIPMTAKGDEGRFSPIRVSRLVGPWVELPD